MDHKPRPYEVHAAAGASISRPPLGWSCRLNEASEGRATAMTSPMNADRHSTEFCAANTAFGCPDGHVGTAGTADIGFSGCLFLLWLA